VKGKYGEPSHWNGMATLFLLLASQRLAELSESELAWLKGLRDKCSLNADYRHARPHGDDTLHDETGTVIRA
jgi:hypothetical protein